MYSFAFFDACYNVEILKVYHFLAKLSVLNNGPPAP